MMSVSDRFGLNLKSKLMTSKKSIGEKSHVGKK